MDQATPLEKKISGAKPILTLGWTACFIIGVLLASWHFVKIGYYPRLGLSDMTAVFAGSFIYTSITIALAAAACFLPSQFWIRLTNFHLEPEFQREDETERAAPAPGTFASLFELFIGPPPGKPAIRLARSRFLFPVIPVVFLWPLLAVLDLLDGWRDVWLGVCATTFFTALMSLRATNWKWSEATRLTAITLGTSIFATVLVSLALFPILAEEDLSTRPDAEPIEVWYVTFLAIATAMLTVVSLIRITAPAVPWHRMLVFPLVLVLVCFAFSPGIDVGAKALFRQVGFGGFDADLVVTQDVAENLRIAGATVDCPPPTSTASPPHTGKCLYPTHVLSALGEEYFVEDPTTLDRIAINRTKVEALVRRERD